jgi:hypothetical protein
MHIERKKDLSVYHWLVDLFSDASYINVVDGFPTENLELPTVAVEGGTIKLKPFELGNRNRIFNRIWFIEIFAKNKSQRDDFSYRILSALENIIPVYDYDEGFPPDVDPTQIGGLDPLIIQATPIKILPEMTEKLYYRLSVSFTAEYSII